MLGSYKEKALDLMITSIFYESKNISRGASIAFSTPGFINLDIQ
jgi:hypothetical protein